MSAKVDDYTHHLSLRDIFRAIGDAIAATRELPGLGGIARIAAMRSRVTRERTAEKRGDEGAGPTAISAPYRRPKGVGAARPAPDLTPGQFSELLRDAADVAVRYWKNLPTRRAFTRPPDEVVERIRTQPLPEAARPLDEIIETMERDVVPYPNGAGHPRWWGFVSSPAHAAGVAAELIATTLDNYVHGTSQIAVDVELKVLDWLAEIIGMPEGSSGLLVSGGSAANLVALVAAREAKAPGTRRSGMKGLERPLAVYASDQIHSCIGKALEVMGLGSNALRVVPTDSDFRIDVAELQRTIREDLHAGIEPLAIVGSAGTVNTGAVDPLDALADIAEEVGCWFHVDGAYGAFAGALPELAERYRGIERADSVAADPHKWLYTPVEAGAVLVRDTRTLEEAFWTRAGYFTLEEGTYMQGTWLADRGFQLSRSFRALKVWAVIQAIGMEGYLELWRNDIAVAREVRRLAHAHPRLDVLADSDLSIFCIRYLPEDGDVDEFNHRLLDLIHRDGRHLVTPVKLSGRYGLRGCVVNFRSTLADARYFVETVLELGERLEREALETGEGRLQVAEPA